MDKDKALAQNLALLGARDALIQPRLEMITTQKDLVEAAVSKCEPEGSTKELVTAFFYLVKTLQSDCRKLREELEEWNNILSAVDLLQTEKQGLQEEESKRAKEMLELGIKGDRRRDLLKLAWSVMLEEMKPNLQEANSSPGGEDSNSSPGEDSISLD